MIWQILVAGGVIGAIAGIILRKKKACSDGCPLHSSPILGLIIGALIGLGVSTAINELSSDKLEAASKVRDLINENENANVTEPAKKAFKTATTDNFDQIVNQKGIVLVDFWAEWCGPCKMMEPVLEKFAANSSEKVKIFKVNIDDSPELAQKFGIQGIPAFAFFSDGKLVGGLVGYQEERTLHNAISKVKEMSTQNNTNTATKE